MTGHCAECRESLRDEDRVACTLSWMVYRRLLCQTDWLAAKIRDPRLHHLLPT